MFNPRYPDTSNSLNRVVLVDLPGLDVTDDVKGKTGYELVSTAALDKLIEAHHADFRFITYKDPPAMRGHFFVLLSHDDPTAIHVAETLGRNLGYLLLTLTRGDEVNRKARPEWSDAHWKLWGSIRTVHLGGGLVTGKMGVWMLKGVRIITTNAGSNLAIDLAHYPQHLPLFGAARYIATGQKSYMLDFGGTYVKRGFAQYGSDGLKQLTLLSSVESAFTNDVIDVRDTMVDIIAETAKDFDAPIIPVSIAAYVDANGQPLIAQGGIYMQLAQLSDDVPAMLSELVSKRIGKPVTIKLLHDGSAAASFYAPEANAVVLMLGTAIGSGYCVLRPELRPVSPNLSLNSSYNV
jgi:hypothetical protein